MKRPRPSPATSAPPIEPIPPSTTTTKVMMTSLKPMLVRIGERGATKAAPRPTAAHSNTKTRVDDLGVDTEQLGQLWVFSDGAYDRSEARLLREQPHRTV